jgi:hypothetical protein
MGSVKILIYLLLLLHLQDRGDCLSTRKTYKTSRFVGWVVGWNNLKPDSTLPLYQFPFLDDRHPVHLLRGRSAVQERHRILWS